ncbi:surface anchored protein [Corynebacterium sp. H78]|uniref:surface anchored protein n=1 Tax=Corynebacterium sp. H78 TaxID=3133417 RepID=UPI00309E9C62
MNTLPVIKKYAPAIVAAACAFSMLGAPVATAAPIVGQPIENVVDANDNSPTNVTITLTQGNPYENGPDGKPNGPADGTIVTIKRLVGIDPYSAEDRLKVNEMTLEEAMALPTDLAFTAITDENGQVEFKDVPNGVYIVTSTRPADDTHYYNEVDPFLLGVPFYQGGQKMQDGVVVAKHKPCPPCEPGEPCESTEPTKPTEPTRPGEPGRPGEPTKKPTRTVTTTRSTLPDRPGVPVDTGGSGSSGGSGKLPITGVAVVGLIAAALALLGAGAVSIRYASKKNQT